MKTFLSASVSFITAVVFASSSIEWKAVGPMHTPRDAHTITLFATGQVLICGGRTTEERTIPGTEWFDPITNEFRAGPDMKIDRAFHSATLLSDGLLLVAAGYQGRHGTIADAEILDGVAFRTLLKLNQRRELHTATLLNDGRVLITGGFVGGPNIALRDTELFDPRDDTFRLAGQMSIGRFGHAATLLNDGRVLITGGRTMPSEDSVRTAEIYDPQSNTFTLHTDMTVDRFRHTATKLNNGCVLITGGYSSTIKRQTSTSELYDPANGEFHFVESLMTDPRMDHTATLLKDGRVLIAGGFRGDADARTVSSCDIFDPTTSLFSNAPPLSTSRHEAAAIRLNDGRLLLTGGFAIPQNAKLAGGEVLSLQSSAPPDRGRWGRD